MFYKVSVISVTIFLKLQSCLLQRKKNTEGQHRVGRTGHTNTIQLLTITIVLLYNFSKQKHNNNNNLAMDYALDSLDFFYMLTN